MAQEFCPGMFQATSPREHVREFCVGYCRLSNTANEQIFLPRTLASMIIESNPYEKKRTHVPFCSVLSDLPKTRVPETVVFVENTMLRSGSLTWVRFGVLCALAKLRHCAFPKTILFKKKKKKDMQFKYSVCPPEQSDYLMCRTQACYAC